MNKPSPLQATDLEATQSATSAPDPFDPARLALSGNSADGIGVKRVLMHVGVRKPNRQEFIRTHPDRAFQLPVAILELKTEQEFYVVLPEIAIGIPGETRYVTLRTTINRLGTVFLWPVPQPSSEGRELAWHVTARDAATRAELAWIRIIPNRSAGAYDVFEAPASIGEPAWPDHSLRDLLQVAFGNGRLVDSPAHPIIQQLLGRA